MIDLSTLENIYTTGKKIYDIVQSIKKAPEAIRELGTQALLVTSVLEAFRDEDADPIDWSTEPRRKILERARELAEQADEFLEKATKATKEDARRKVRKWRWILGDEADAKELADKFHKFHGSLNTVVLLRSPVVQRQTETIQSSQCIHTNIQELRTEQHLMLELVRIEQTETQQILRRVLAAVEANEGDRGVNGGQFADPGLRASLSAFGNDGPRQSTNGNDATVSCSVMNEFPGSPGYHSGHCGPNCKCRCHTTPVSIVPLVLNLLLGRSQPRVKCNEPTCKHLQRMTFSVLRSFRQVTAEVWIEGQSLTHVTLRMPRVVGENDLFWLERATLDEVRQKLSNRELTINDVHPDGLSVLHVSVSVSGCRAAIYGPRSQNATARLTWDRSEAALSIVALLTEHSAPTDWEWNGLTPTERALWWSLVCWRWYESRESAFNVLRFRLAPYLPQDIDAHEGFVTKMRWSGLHQFFCRLSSPDLTSIPHDLIPQVNVRDSFGRTPLFYAMLVGPEAIHALLRTGANPRIDFSILMWAAQAGADTAISTLVRAGAYINASDLQDRRALHWAAFPDLMYSINGLAVALELVRHAGHLLDWDMRDEYGRTPLDWAQVRARTNPGDEDSRHILELYRTRRLPDGAQYLPTPFIVGAEDEAAEDDTSGLPSTSLVRVALRGDVEAIGDLIHRGAMVNERDREGRTLLHLVALGIVPNGYRVALELVRHGGWGVDWNALVAGTYIVSDNDDEDRKPETESESDDEMERFGEDQTGGVCDSDEVDDEGELDGESDDDKNWPEDDICSDDDPCEEYETVNELASESKSVNDGDEGEGEDQDHDEWTALDIADYRLRYHELSEQDREELEKIWILLKAQRLPPDEEHLWPCMDPDFYPLPMPGAWRD